MYMESKNNKNKNRSASKKVKICDDTCEYCLYIGEGDFICEKNNEPVWTDWCPIYGNCIAK